MFLRLIELSIRGKQVALSLIVGAVVTALASCAVLCVTHSHLRGRIRESMNLSMDDLRKEYSEYGGLSDQFKGCVDDDVEERGATTTRILVLSPSGTELYATPPLRNPKHERKSRIMLLPDGNRLMVERDIEDVHQFELFLGCLLVVIGIVSVVLVGVFAYLLGGRILKLNQVVEAKNRAIEELRTLTDDIAHDLRTPLTRLHMAAEAAVTCGSSESLTEQVAHDTNAMVEMINTMLEISQAGFRMDRTPRENLVLTDIVRQSIELYGAIAEDLGVALCVRLPDAPVCCSAHKTKVQQVIGNLIDNALKFTPQGGTVTLELAEDALSVRLTVADDGCGIAEKDLPHIFQRFYRADSSRNLPGNGLGLALVHAIVTSYGGTVTCVSSPGSGTRFDIVFPKGQT